MPVSANGKASIQNVISVPSPECHYCGKGLDFQFDYSCITCGRLTCDNHNDVCSEEYDEDYEEKGCDLVACIVCIETHTKTHHPDTP